MGEGGKLSRKVFSLVLIVLLTLSSIGMANSDIMASGSLDVKKTEVSPVQEVTTANLSSHPSKKVEVDLSESVGITSDSPKAQPQNQVSNSSPELPSVKTQVSLSESLSIHDNSPAKDAFLVLKQNSDSVTTMDRISSLDRVRFNGKSIVVNDPYAADKMITEPIMILANSETHIGKILFQDVGTAFEKTGAGMLNYVSHAGYLSSIQDSVRYLSGGMEVAGGSMSGIVHDSANGKNPAMFLLLVPLSGYILIRAEGTRLRVSNTRQIFSLFFIAILISSAVIVPISSSAGYLAYAYSQANNSSINSANSNQSNSSSPLSFNG